MPLYHAQHLAVGAHHEPRLRPPARRRAQSWSCARCCRIRTTRARAPTSAPSAAREHGVAYQDVVLLLRRHLAQHAQRACPPLRLVTRARGGARRAAPLHQPLPAEALGLRARPLLRRRAAPPAARPRAGARAAAPAAPRCRRGSRARRSAGTRAARRSRRTCTSTRSRRPPTPRTAAAAAARRAAVPDREGRTRRPGRAPRTRRGSTRPGAVAQRRRRWRRAGAPRFPQLLLQRRLDGTATGTGSTPCARRIVSSRSRYATNGDCGDALRGSSGGGVSAERRRGRRGLERRHVRRRGGAAAAAKELGEPASLLWRGSGAGSGAGVWAGAGSASRRQLGDATDGLAGKSARRAPCRRPCAVPVICSAVVAAVAAAAARRPRGGCP